MNKTNSEIRKLSLKEINHEIQLMKSELLNDTLNLKQNTNSPNVHIRHNRKNYIARLSTYKSELLNQNTESGNE
jgi:ribosomal protein L29